MSAEFIAIVTVGVALAGLILHSNRELWQDLAQLPRRRRRNMIQMRKKLTDKAAAGHSTRKGSQSLRCARCSKSLPRGSRGPSARLCKKCRKREQNKRAYQRRKAKAAQRENRSGIA